MSLVPNGVVTVCPGGNVTFRCMTTGGSQLWETNRPIESEHFSHPGPQQRALGIFNLILVGFMQTVIGNMTVMEVNSTATTTNVQPNVDGVTLNCSETTGFVKDQATLSFAG